MNLKKIFAEFIGANTMKGGGYMTRKNSKKATTGRKSARARGRRR